MIPRAFFFTNNKKPLLLDDLKCVLSRAEWKFMQFNWEALFKRRRHGSSSDSKFRRLLRLLRRDANVKSLVSTKSWIEKTVRDPNPRSPQRLSRPKVRIFAVIRRFFCGWLRSGVRVSKFLSPLFLDTTWSLFSSFCLLLSLVFHFFILQSRTTNKKNVSFF